MMDDLSRQKSALRRSLRQRRQAFVRARDGLPWRAPDHKLAAMLSSDVVVATYNSMGSEADPASLAHWASVAGAILAWPRVDADGTMRFYALGPSRRMVPDGANIAAPAADGVLVAPNVILLPLLGFDRYGTRLGQGAGFYDRTIATLDAARPPGTQRAHRIGIAWSVQEEDALPRDDWDMPLDAIITEQQWIEP